VFPGKTVLITGAASGMGKATTLSMLKKGCNVIATDVNFAGLEALQQQQQQSQSTSTPAGSLTIRKMDVSNQADVDRVFGEL